MRTDRDTKPSLRRFEAVLYKRWLNVVGTPPDNDDEEAGHNCDAMGCGSVGPHILLRVLLDSAQVEQLVGEEPSNGE